MLHNSYTFLRLAIILLILGVCVVSCHHATSPALECEYVRVKGTAIGTFYNITYQDSAGRDLQVQFDSLFSVFNHQFSLFDSTSVLSQFNASEWGIVDKALAHLTSRAQELVTLTHGAFDPTAGNLIAAWGFARNPIFTAPEDTLLYTLLQSTGMEKVSVKGDSVLKSVPSLQLNFNAIAKGLLVDQTAAYLTSLGIDNYLVEIGGEVYAKGINPRGTAWRLGIETPDSGFLPGSNIIESVTLRDSGMATSGNYRQKRTLQGKSWSHIIDPRSGYPASSNLLSATVIAPTTTTADAIATALIVEGLSEAQKRCQEIDSIRVILIYKQEDGSYGIWTSPQKSTTAR